MWLLASLCSCGRWCKKVLTEHLSFEFFRKSLAAVRKSIYFYAYNSNQTMKKPPLIITLLLLAVSCTRYPSAVERTLRFAGENRVELERVMERYRESGEEEKYRAACFLIGNMGGHGSKDGPALRKYYRELSAFYDRPDVDVRSLYAFEDSLFKTLDFSNLDMYYDARNISASYLEKRIEDAFSVRGSKWAEGLSFGEFCEYVLPYRVGDELLEDWTDDYRSTFGPALDSLAADGFSTLEDFCIAVNGLFPQPHRSYTGYPAGKPSPAPSSLKRIAGGTCEDYLGLFTYLGRSYGVPVATDYTPQWANHSKNHSWCGVIRGDSTYHYTVGGWLSPVKERKFTYKLSKVYRRMSSIQPESLAARLRLSELPPALRSPRIKDVSAEYMPVTAVSISGLFRAGRSKHVFLCCFDDKDWVAVSGEKRRGSDVTVPDMGYPAVYLPAYYAEGALVPAQYPVLVDSSAMQHVLRPDTDSLRTVRLKRKFMELRARQFADMMKGGRFELADNASFKNAKTIELPDSIGYNFQTLEVGGGRYRYVRYVPKPGTTGDISEIEVYGSDEPYSKLEGKTIGNYRCADTQHPMSNATDCDALTYATCMKTQTDAWTGVDLGKPVAIDKVCFLPRSDDNFIRGGEEYELCYWDGRWVSLGRQTGDRWSQELIFENVPDNALLLLHDLTRGKEERIFTYEGGRQIWW